MAIGGISALMQGIGAHQQAKGQEAIARFNAKQAMAQAGAVAKQQERQGRRDIGDAYAGFSSLGGDVPINRMADLVKELEEQRLLTLWGGESESAGYKLGGDVARRQGNLALGSSLVVGGAMLTGGVIPAYKSAFPSVGGVTPPSAPPALNPAMTGANRNFAQYAP